MSDINSGLPIDILNADLTSVDTDRQVLQKGIVDLTISDAKLEQTKKGTGVMLWLTFKTAIPYPNLKGVTKAPGFQFRDSIFIPTGDGHKPETIEMCKTKLAQLKEAAFGTKEGAFGTPDQYIGRTVTARITVDSSEEYGDQNRVSAFVKRNG